MEKTLEVQGKKLYVDEEGYLCNPNDWSPEVALVMAEQDALELSEAHWEIIHFLREYYAKEQLAPFIVVLLRVVAERFGEEKGNSRYLYKLFPYGPDRQATRLAGLPKPSGCA